MKQSTTDCTGHRASDHPGYRKRHHTTRYICAFLVALLGAGELYADRIILKNGRTIDGTLIGQSRAHIRVRSNGRVVRIAKERISRILYGDFAPKRSAVKKTVPPKKKRPAVDNKPAGGKKTPSDELRVVVEQLRATQERARLAEKRFREAEEKVKQASLRAKVAEAKRLEASRLAQKWERQIRVSKATMKEGRSSAWNYLLPGLGQWRKQENWKAGLAGGFFLLNAFNLYDANEQWKKERTVYESLNSFGAPSPTATSNPAFAAAYAQVFESRQANIDAQYNRTRTAFIGLLLVYAWNYVDLRWFRSGKSEKRTASGQWRVDLSADTGVGTSRTVFKDLSRSTKGDTGIRFFFSAKIF